MPEKFAVYFSHSWEPEQVDLNLFVWEQIHDSCKLLMDLPDESAQNPPYYINRIEELLCRSDLFVAVLPYRKPKQGAPGGAPPVGAPTYCSEAALFEIGLAERADLPRLVLYDVRTRFKPPQNPPRHAVYIRRQFEELNAALPAGEEALKERIREWLTWEGKQLRPKGHDRPIDAYILLSRGLPEREKVFGRISKAVTGAGFASAIDIDGAFHNDAEVSQILSCGGLLVADVSDGEQFPVYCVAHALFVPAVRLWPGAERAVNVADLPSLLRGHPGGYQWDVVGWDAPDFEKEIEKHAAAMIAAARPVADYEEGRRLFEKRRYREHSVFLSHNLPQDDRQLIVEIMRRFKDAAIKCWEYLEANRAGEDWRQRMEEELKKATHFAVLLSPTYEQSDACVAEIEWAQAHAVPVIPFNVNGRSNPHVKMRGAHHQPLTSGPAENAAAAVERVRDILLLKKTPADP